MAYTQQTSNKSYGKMEPTMMPMKGCPATEKMKYKCNSTPSEKYTPNEYQGSDMMMFMCYMSENQNQNQNRTENNSYNQRDTMQDKYDEKNDTRNNPSKQQGSQTDNQHGNQQDSQQDSQNQQGNRNDSRQGDQDSEYFNNEQNEYPQDYEYEKGEEERYEAFTREEEEYQNYDKSGAFEMTSQMKEFDQTYASGDFENFTKSQEFKPYAGMCKAMNVTGCSKMKVFAVMGMGQKNSDCPAKMKKMATEAAKHAAKYKTKSMTFMFPPEMKSSKCMEKFMEQFYTACTAQNSYFSNPEANDPYDQMETAYFTTSAKFHKNFEKMNEKAKAMAEMTCMAQQMASAPPNYCNPTTFANAAAAMAQKAGMEFKAYDQEFMEKENMGGMMAVSKGSNYPPKFFHMSYKPSGKAEAKYAFVGCGMTYDSGGYNMKHDQDMDKMKYSMSGAAACMAAAYYMGMTQPPKVQADFFVFAGENMVSSKSFKPGDVYTTYSGKTVEAKSTDCAACMAMCDAVAFAAKNTDADKYFEFSNTTDTFAQAFGTEYAAMFCSDMETMKEFYKSSTKAGEKMMPTPFFPQPNENHSETADYSSTPNTRYGNATANASFMKKFAQGKPFTHVEMTGPSYNPYTKTGTGFGAATCAQYMEDMSEKYCREEFAAKHNEAKHMTGYENKTSEEKSTEAMYHEKQKEANKENPTATSSNRFSFRRN